jgi:hypothetical protein
MQKLSIAREVFLMKIAVIFLAVFPTLKNSTADET